jgi:extradiol dioxygenase family protein
MQETILSLTPFHIAFPVDDLDAARSFYGITLGCAEGRSSSQWIDFDLFGHQIVAHLKPGTSGAGTHHNAVDGHDVPVPHFGVVLPMETWEALAERLRRAEVISEAQEVLVYATTLSRMSRKTQNPPYYNVLVRIDSLTANEQTFTCFTKSESPSLKEHECHFFNGSAVSVFCRSSLSSR